MYYIKSRVSSLNKAGSAICVRSSLHLCPAYLSSTKCSCFDDCTQFMVAGQWSQINLSLALFLSLSSCTHSAYFSERRSRRKTETLVSAAQQEPESRHKHSSARLIFVGLPRCLRTQSWSSQTDISPSLWSSQHRRYSFSPELQHLFEIAAHSTVATIRCLYCRCCRVHWFCLLTGHRWNA